MTKKDVRETRVEAKKVYNQREFCGREVKEEEEVGNV